MLCVATRLYTNTDRSRTYELVEVSGSLTTALIVGRRSRENQSQIKSLKGSQLTAFKDRVINSKNGDWSIWLLHFGSYDLKYDPEYDEFDLGLYGDKRRLKNGWRETIFLYTLRSKESAKPRRFLNIFHRSNRSLQCAFRIKGGSAEKKLKRYI